LTDGAGTPAGVAQPSTNPDECAFLASFAFTVATSVGERMVARERSKAEASRIGRTTARMLTDTLGL
jgi:hypothetical protein